VSWLLDERAHAGREHLDDDDDVAGYEAKAGFDPAETVELLRAHGLESGSPIVDLGAGTGTVAAAVAAHCRRVVPVDPSPAVVRVLRARGLEAVEAGFLTYAHEGEPPQLAHSRNALHHTYAWLLEPLLLHAGFEIVAASLHGVSATYVCTRT
jgi:SAM-dependent methyltransferase